MIHFPGNSYKSHTVCARLHSCTPALLHSCTFAPLFSTLRLLPSAFLSHNTAVAASNFVQNFPLVLPDPS
jgi:hypothetical protein